MVLVVDSFAEKNGDAAHQSSDAGSGADSDQQSHRRLRYVLTTSTECQVAVGPEFIAALTDIVGESCFDLKASKARKAGGGSIGR